MCVHKISCWRTALSERCLTLKAAHYTQCVLNRGLARRDNGLSQRGQRESSAKHPAKALMWIQEKSANNAHGAHNCSYAIMRAEIKGASQ
jgi:hypothetical protein